MVGGRSRGGRGYDGLDLGMDLMLTDGKKAWWEGGVSDATFQRISWGYGRI